jgi:hypothetical protein
MNLEWPEPNPEPGIPAHVGRSSSITVQATFLSIYSRRPNEDGSEWIAAKINAGGFSSASGVAREPFKKGDLVEMTGHPTAYKGDRQIKFAVARRIDPSPLDSEAATLIKFGLSRTHVEALRSTLGPSFAERVAAEPALMDHAAFARWRATTRAKIGEACRRLNETGVRLKALTAIVGSGEAAKIEDFLQHHAVSVYELVRCKILSLGDAHRLAQTELFRPWSDKAVSYACGAIWQYLNDRADHTAHDIHGMSERLRVQHAIDGETFAAALSHSMTPIGDDKFEVVKFQSALVRKPALDAERFIWKNINAASSNNLKSGHKRRLCKISVELNPEQTDAVLLALNSPISFIAGGLGTGKTTICEAIARTLGGAVMGAALAYRAARNLEQRAGIHAAVIASLPGRRDEFRNLEALIIDEASMIGSATFASIIRHARRSGVERIIFVGDDEQLAPIDEGQPFADIVRSDKAPIVKLDRVYRFAEGGGIAAICRDVRRGGPFENFTQDAYPGVEFHHETDGANVVSLAADAYSRLVENEVEPLDIAIVAPFKKRGLDGVRQLNLSARQGLGRLNAIEPGDVVVGNKDNPELNGTRGVVSEIVIIKNEPHARIDFEHGARATFPVRPHTLGPCPTLDFGYALTIHKFQGSQAKHIIAVIPANSDFLFGKPLLYTALSRAQTSLTVIGDIEAIPRIAARESAQRETALKLLFGGGV